MTYAENKKQKENKPIKKVIAKEEVQIQTVLQEKSIYLKKENPSARYLKINPFYRQSQNSKTPAKIVPEVKLCGNWLEEAGFSAGGYVSVTVMDGLLVIRAAQIEAGEN